MITLMKKSVLQAVLPIFVSTKSSLPAATYFTKSHKLFLPQYDESFRKIQEIMRDPTSGLTANPSPDEIIHHIAVLTERPQHIPYSVEEEEITWEFLSQQVLNTTNNLDPHGFAISAYAFCRKPRAAEHTTLWPELEKGILRHQDALEAGDVSQCVIGFSEAEKGHEQLWIALEKACKRTVHQMNQRDLAHCINGFAKMNRGNEELWQELETGVKNNAQKMNPTSVTQCVRGFAQMNRDDTGLWDTLERAASRVGNWMTDPELVSTIDAFGKMQKGDRELWRLLEKIVKSDIQKLDEGSVTTVITGFSRIGRSNPELWHVLAESVERWCDTMNANHLVDCMEGLKHGHVHEGRIWNTMAKRVVIVSKDMSAPILARCVGCFSDIKGLDGNISRAMWKALSDRSVQLANSIDPSVTAFCARNLQSEEFHQSLAREM